MSDGRCFEKINVRARNQVCCRKSQHGEQFMRHKFAVLRRLAITQNNFEFDKEAEVLHVV